MLSEYEGEKKEILERMNWRNVLGFIVGRFSTKQVGQLRVSEGAQGIAAKALTQPAGAWEGEKMHGKTPLMEKRRKVYS